MTAVRRESHRAGNTLARMSEGRRDALEERLFGSVLLHSDSLHSLPVGMAEQPSAATGTVMRTATFRRYAGEAGFGTVEVLPIENDFWRFYRLRP
jgi:hypothetical protein